MIRSSSSSPSSAYDHRRTMEEGEGDSRAVRVAPPCVGFEPQEWRRSVCRNCFRTRDRHRQNAVSGPDEERPQPEMTSPPTTTKDNDQNYSTLERLASFEAGETVIEESGGIFLLLSRSEVLKLWPADHSKRS